MTKSAKGFYILCDYDYFVPPEKKDTHLNWCLPALKAVSSD